MAGQHPFRVDQVSALLEDILHHVPDVAALAQNSQLSPVITRLIAKRPEERYADTASVLTDFAEATGQQLPTETALTRESLLQAARFIGREAEMNQLSSALADTLKGKGSLWLVGGESGIGKSRLLDELRTLALVEGTLVLRGQSISEGGTPYLLWRDALRHLCLQTDLGEMEKSVLKALVPDIGTLLGNTIPNAPELDPQDAQNRLITVMNDVFARQNQPILVILEDLQWAGNESLTMLQRLGRQVGQQKLLIIASYRIDERPGLPQELPNAELLSLKRLPQDRIADLTASILGESVGRQSNLTDLLAHETEGNVFFMIEVLRALAEEVGQLDRIGMTTLPPQVFSGGMRNIVQRRLNRVPEWAQPLLEIAATIGRQVDPVILAAAQADIDLNSWLAICSDMLVLDFQDNQWRFSHDKLREGLLADLSPEHRRELHQKAALAIEQCYPNDPSRAAALAAHWGSADNPNKEAHYTALAGEQALRVGANHQAIQFLEHADSLAEQVGTTLVRHVEIRYLLSSAYVGIGNMEQAAKKLESTLKLGGFAIPQGQTQLVLQILVHSARQVWHRLVLDVFKRPQRPPRNAELLSLLSRAADVMVRVTYAFNDLPATFYYGFVNVNLAEEAGQAYRDLQARGYAMLINGMEVLHFHSVVRHYQRLMEKAINPDSEPYTHYWTQLTLGMTAAMRGEWAPSQENLISSSRWANEIGNARHWLEAQTFLESALLMSGNLAKGKTVCEEHYARAAHTQDMQSQGFALGNLACLLICEGDIEQTEIVLKQIDQLADRTPGHTPFTFTLGLFVQNLMRQGQPESAETYLRQFLSLPNLNAPIAFILTPVYSSVAESVLTLCELDPSQAHRVAAQKMLRAMRSCGRSFDCAKPFALHYDGWMAWLDNKPGRAVRLGEQAINAAHRLEMPYAEGLAHYHLGRHLPSEDHRRVEHLRQAESIFERLGAAYDLDKARQALSKPFVTGPKS